MASIKAIVSVMILATTIGVATVGFHHFERAQELTWTESLYFTVVTITTVGYGEIHPQTPAGQLFAIPVIIIGVSSGLSTLTFVFGPLLEERVRIAVTGLTRPRERKDHVILCGSGDLADIVAKELSLSNVPYVRANREQIPGEEDMVIGDPSEESTLRAAGINRAISLVTVLDDREGFFVVLEAKRLRKDLRVIAAVRNPENQGRLEEVGADMVVACDTISSRLLTVASERHFSMGFFDTQLSTRPIALSEISIPESSPTVGKTLQELSIPQRFALSVVAITRGNKLHPNPDPSEKLEAGGQIVVFGERKNASKLRNHVSGGKEATTHLEVPKMPMRKHLPSELRSRGPRIVTNLFLIILIMVFYQLVSPIFSAAGLTLNLQEVFSLAIFFVVFAAIGYLLFSILSDFRVLVDAGFLRASELDALIDGKGPRRIVRNVAFIVVIVVLGLVVTPILGAMGGLASWIGKAIPWICLGLLVAVLYDIGSFLHGALTQFVRRIVDGFARTLEEGD